MKRALCILGVLGMAASANAISITQNVSQTPVAGSVSCNAGGIASDNAYLRSFNLASFGITQPFVVDSVSFAVEQTSGINVGVRLYNGSLPNTYAALGAAYANTGETIPLASGALYSVTAPVNGAQLATTGPNLVVEIYHSASASASLWIGSKSAGQTGPCYIASAGCGIPNPTSLAAIGFPGMHVIMTVNGHEVPAPASAGLLGLAGLAAARRRR